MEEQFEVQSLGTAMLTKGTTGLGVIQKPLKEKYFALHKNANTKEPQGPEVGIRINPHGVTLMYPGPSPGHDQEDFYDISSIHFMEAVHFETIKKDKKFYFAFLPVDKDSATNAAKDKLFSPLDKKFHFLAKMPHPALLASVMRRTTGVKAVDCHMFIVPYIDDALKMAAMVRQFQTYHVSGDYGPPPPAGLPRQDVYPNPDVVPRDTDEFAVYRGRGVELRQDHFNRGPGEPEVRGSRNSGGYPEQNRSFERDRHSAGYLPSDRDRKVENFPEPQRGRVVSDDYGRYPRDPGGHSDYGRQGEARRSMEFRDTTGYKEKDSYGREYEFDNAIRHERQSSGDQPGLVPHHARYGSGSGSDRSSGRNEFGATRGDRSSGNYPADREYNRGRQSPPRQYRDNQPQRSSYPEPPYNPGRPPYSPPTSPRGRISPGSPRGRSPPRPQSPGVDDNVYSASNLESRQETDAQGKPIAKVPPHRHAGIKVLPSLPLALNQVQLKPVSPRSPTAPKKIEDNPPPKYNFDQDDDSDEENPYDNAPAKIPDLRRGRVQSDKAGYDVERRPHGEVYPAQDRRPVSDSYYGYSKAHPNDQYGRQSGSGSAAPARNSSNKLSASQDNRPWSYMDEKEKFLKDRNGGWKGDYRSQSAHEMSDSGSNTSGDGVRKDAEIANMFSNLRTSHGPNEAVDFERSLGYLP